MYIKKVRKKNHGSDVVYEYLHLVENVRTENGPRQRLILNLGNLDVHEDKYKELANCIESFLVGQETLFSNDLKIEKIARDAVSKIFKNRINSNEETNNLPYQNDFRNVDVNSIETSEVRSIGPEYVCHQIWKKLNLNSVLADAGMLSHYIPIIETLVIGRLVDPGSELHTFQWAEERSSIYELVEKPAKLPLCSFYKAGDAFFKQKDLIEKNLSVCERDIFFLKEKMILFDLTNTYFEGEVANNPKAKRGHSKEKRSDAKLLTLALIVDENGFAKYSQLFAGNQYEGKVLEGILDELEKNRPDLVQDRTVIMDAGIANSDNIKLLKKKKFHYIVIKRGMSDFSEKDTKELVSVIKDEKGKFRVEIKRKIDSEEAFLLCRSQGRIAKDNSIRCNQEKLFLERIEYYRSGLSKKQRTKSYSKILEMIGRLREKYPQASKVYDVEVVPKKETEEETKEARNEETKEVPKERAKPVKQAILVEEIKCSKRDNYEQEESFDGCYVMQTDRIDLSDEEIWNTYTMLTRIEQSFRALKSSLGLRPIFHRKEERADAHMFISVVAYHILQAIEWQLHKHGDFRSWETIRKVLSTHQRMTIEFKEKSSTGLSKSYIRLCSNAEVEHKLIYQKLNLKSIPLPRKKVQR